MKTLAVLVLLLALFASITVARGGGSRRCASREQKKAFKRAAKAGNGLCTCVSGTYTVCMRVFTIHDRDCGMKD